MGEYTDLDLCWKWIGADFKANINMKDDRFFYYFEQRNFDCKSWKKEEKTIEE